MSVAPYFADCISAQDLDEVNIEIIRSSLFKSYLEDFHKFCRTRLNAETFRYMSKILELEADQRCINITLNSIGTELNKQERLALYPKIGILYPEGHQALSQVDETDEVKSILIRYPVGGGPFAACPFLYLPALTFYNVRHHRIIVIAWI